MFVLSSIKYGGGGKHICYRPSVRILIEIWILFVFILLRIILIKETPYPLLDFNISPCRIKQNIADTKEYSDLILIRGTYVNGNMLSYDSKRMRGVGWQMIFRQKHIRVLNPCLVIRGAPEEWFLLHC